MGVERRRINVYDVAQVAGVSIATVAHVLAGRGSGGEARRARIVSAVRDLGYKPDRYALSLVRERRQAIAFAAPIQSRAYLAFFESGILEGVAVAAAMRGWDLHYVLVPPRGRFPTKDHAETVDATIAFDDAVESPAFRPLLESDHPVVLLNRRDENFPCVSVDNRLGGRLAVEHLLGLGHERVALVWSGGRIGEERRDGAHDAFRAAGLEPVAEFDVRWDRLAAREGIRRHLTGPHRVTAVFVFSDWMALGVLAAAAEAGLSVPRDLSVVGFDDALICEATVPPLTTVRQPLRRIGEEAVDALAGLLGDVSAAAARRQVAPELVVRSSTSRPPRGR